MQLLEGQMHAKCDEVQNGGRAMFTCTSTSVGSTTSKPVAKQHSNSDFTKKERQTTLQPNSPNKDPQKTSPSNQSKRPWKESIEWNKTKSTN